VTAGFSYSASAPWALYLVLPFAVFVAFVLSSNLSITSGFLFYYALLSAGVTVRILRA